MAMHWLMLLLLIAVYACINLRELFPRASDLRGGLKTWHLMLEIVVFALVLVRMALRWSGVAPRIQPEPPAWQQRLAGLMHLALYAFMFAMPVLGWPVLSAAASRSRS